MVLTEGFLLGIANGGGCLAYCAPVLVPYLLGEGGAPRRNAISVGGFLGGRLVGYLAFAATGLHVHPLYTGGEIAQTIDHGRYRTLVHHPVFDGLAGQRDRGFVQIQWQPKDANLPAKIDEQIDFDGDGANDLRIQLDTVTHETDLEPLDGRVLSVDDIVAVPGGRIARVGLRRTPR